MSAHCRRGHFAFEHGAPCHHLWAGKFKSSVILCDMKQVCELSEDACARRVMSSTWSVSTSQSLASLGRSSGQLGGLVRSPPLLPPQPPCEPEHRSKAQQGPATNHPEAAHGQLGNYPQLHTFASAPHALGLPRVTRNIFPELFRAAAHSCPVAGSGPGGPASLVAGGQYQVSLIKRRASAHSPAGCLIKNTDKFIYAPPRKTSRPSSIT